MPLPPRVPETEYAAGLFAPNPHTPRTRRASLSNIYEAGEFKDSRSTARPQMRSPQEAAGAANMSTTAGGGEAGATAESKYDDASMPSAFEAGVAPMPSAFEASEQKEQSGTSLADNASSNNNGTTTSSRKSSVDSQLSSTSSTSSASSSDSESLELQLLTRAKNSSFSRLRNNRK